MILLLTAWIAVSALLLGAIIYVGRPVDEDDDSELEMTATDRKIKKIAERCQEALDEFETGADHYDEAVVPVSEINRILSGR